MNEKIEQIADALETVLTAIMDSDVLSDSAKTLAAGQIAMAALVRLFGDRDMTPEELRESILEMRLEGAKIVSDDDLDAQLEELLKKWE